MELGAKKNTRGWRRGVACLLCLLGVAAMRCPAGGRGEAAPPDLAVLREWRAGERVSLAAVAQFGLDSCFVAERLSDQVFARMRGKSYKADCTVPRGRLRYVKVLHHDGKGNIRLGELVCHETLARDLVDIFRKLYEARYPIERMLLVDRYDADDDSSMRHNNTSCFNFRRVSGSVRLSSHSLGCAVDINPLYNPCVRRRTRGGTLVQPAEGKPYADRTAEFPYKIQRDDLCHRLFLSHGFTWGGGWTHVKDYQHFEKMPPRR